MNKTPVLAPLPKETSKLDAKDFSILAKIAEQSRDIEAALDAMNKAGFRRQR